MLSMRIADSFEDMVRGGKASPKEFFFAIAVLAYILLLLGCIF